MPIRYLSGLSVDSTVLVVDAANDRVGIGTASPAYPLDIVGFANSSSGFRVTDGTIDNRVSWSSGNVGFFGTVSNHPIAFNTNLTERMRITAGGNVGIGTTSPGAKLEVYGASPTTVYESQLRIYSSETTGAQDTGGAIAFSGHDGVAGRTFGSIRSMKENSTVGNYAGYMSFGTRANNTDLVERMRITSGGNVGIGTTSPSYKLQVYNSSNGTTAAFGGTTYGIRIDNGGTFSSGRSTIYGVDSTFYGSYQPLGIGASEIYFNISGTDRVIINSSGNVGIGTTAPGEKLVVSGASVGITIDGTTASRIYYNRSGTYIWSTGLRAGDTKFHIFDERASDRLVIDDSGNVGIGTTSPATALQVNGTARATRLNSTGGVVDFDAETGNNFIQIASNIVSIANGGNVSMTITATGNVGIGTTSPANTLQIGSVGATGYGGNRLAVGDGTNVVVLHPGAVSYLTANGDIVVGAGGNTTNQVYVKSGGNVGIGTTSPLSKLQVRAGLDQNFRVASSTNLTVASINDADSAYAPITFRASTFDFQNGNVGIGTTSPSALLNVAGSVTIGSASVATVNLYLTRTNGGVVADANYFVSGNNTPNQTWIEGGYYTGELAGVVTAPNSGYPYFEAYSGQGSATAKSFGFVNKTSGSFISTDFLYTMSLLRTGQIRFNQYGSGSFTGTVAYNLAVDSSGNIIETAGGVVDGSGTANYVSKWSDANTVTNSIIRDDGTTVGIGTAPAAAKLTVDGSITAGGQTNYGKSYGSIDTTGQAVAGLIASTNGQGSMFTFTCRGGGGEYQRVVYSCYNDGGTWYTNKVIDEGTNALDVTASANGATITFTFKARSTTQAYTPAVLVQQFGSAINTSYL